jgi:hypothetical protein
VESRSLADLVFEAALSEADPVRKSIEFAVLAPGYESRNGRLGFDKVTRWLGLTR